jgi:hypothetical protein
MSLLEIEGFHGEYHTKGFESCSVISYTLKNTYFEMTNSLCLNIVRKIYHSASLFFVMSSFLGVNLHLVGRHLVGWEASQDAGNPKSPNSL